jgi:hypothetical protein
MLSPSRKIQLRSKPELPRSKKRPRKSWLTSTVLSRIFSPRGSMLPMIATQSLLMAQNPIQKVP